MTRRERLVNIALRTYENHEQGLFLSNMTPTVLSNLYTQELAITGNFVLGKQYRSTMERVEVLNIHKNL